MDPKSNPGPSEAYEEVRDLTQQLKLMQATDLAAAGHYQQALSVLDTLPRGITDIGPVADLRARIAAQKGDLRLAEAYWSDAVEANPENQHYQVALKRVRADIQSPARLRWNFALLGRAFLVVGSLVVLFLAFHSQQQIETSQVALIERIATLESTINEQVAAQGTMSGDAISDLAASRNVLETELTHQLDDLHQDLLNQGNVLDTVSATQSEMLAHLVDKPPEPVHINLPGIQMEIKADWIETSFEQGLFTDGVNLNPNARDLLLNLGHELNQFTDNYHITVVGYTDDIECGACTGSTLNLARAELVVELLSEATNLSLDGFAIRLPGDRPAPYPNTSTENRLRNRTVILLLSPIMQQE